ncbi:hypothetical protein Ga0074812_14218 [Parafrankia irregularis]|uniref:Uncharacterized protein n=1 Tax=Parafrankia irregularis TaxID=795642 RepID=A0A0S4R003_9ACTN|nr:MULTISPECIES: hypothetical protein [Parafrankia]MBE3203604.1 hypothetical protein [Parafrankia sp. CH37]CUU60540.1 hypothetical protein Ga0074812_14218 [Parafrankia irregularis]
MTQLLVVLLAVSLVLAIGSVFLLTLSRFTDERRDVADVERLRAAQYVIAQGGQQDGDVTRK